MRVIRPLENFNLRVGDTSFENNPLQQSERGFGVGERIVPAEARALPPHLIVHAKVGNEITKGE